MGRLRWAGLALVGIAALATVGLAACAAGGDDGYRVRAIFDNAASAVPGGEVRIAGAKVGRVESMDVTSDKRAALVLQIDDDRFTPFRADARCSIRPQSLISEKFVECEPGTAGHPRLERVDRVSPHRRSRADRDDPVAVGPADRQPARERRIAQALLVDAARGHLAEAGREHDRAAAAALS